MANEIKQRDIKFRALVTCEKGIRMLYFDPQIFDDGVKAWPIPNDIESIDSYESPLMQGTGLIDSTGHEVFEGDIVKFTKWNRTSGGNMELKGVVEWNPQGGGMWITNGKYYTILQELVLSGGENGFYMDNLEVIGNIYQTPELVSE